MVPHFPYFMRGISDSTNTWIDQLTRTTTVVCHVHIVSRLTVLHLILLTSIGGRPKPVICFLAGQLRSSC